MENGITKQQIKSIYAMGASLGLVEHGSHSRDDLLHQLVEATTGGCSVSALTRDEGSKVIGELTRRMRGLPDEPQRRSPKKRPETPGGMTSGQQNKVWQLMYRLREYDDRPMDASLGARLCGIIKRQFSVDASPKDPFRFLRYPDGVRLIEIIKKYCDSAAGRRQRAGGGA